MAAPPPVPTVTGMTTTNTESPAAAGRLTRAAALAGLVGAVLQILGGILETVDRVGPAESGFALRTSIIGIAYLLLAVSVVGLANSGVAGPGWPSRLGLACATLGWILSAVAQFILRVDFDLAEKILFPAATVMIGLGMLLAGGAALRARSLPGWRRATPLICGLYPFLVIFPVFAATGAPNFLVLSGWGVCWLALSGALYRAR